MSEEEHGEESSCRCTRQGEECLQGVRSMRATGVHREGEHKSAEAHER